MLQIKVMFLSFKTLKVLTKREELGLGFGELTLFVLELVGERDLLATHALDAGLGFPVELALLGEGLCLGHLLADQLGEGVLAVLEALEDGAVGLLGALQLGLDLRQLCLGGGLLLLQLLLGLLGGSDLHAGLGVHR